MKPFNICFNSNFTKHYTIGNTYNKDMVYVSNDYSVSGIFKFLGWENSASGIHTKFENIDLTKKCIYTGTGKILDSILLEKKGNPFFKDKVLHIECTLGFYKVGNSTFIEIL